MRDEDYKDEIKLPTDKDIPWEIVSKCGGTLYRIKIENGYLYLKTSISGSDGSMCFVQDNIVGNKEILEMTGELSFKLNKMQDSLREFEKEKVDTLNKKVESNTRISGMLRDNIRILEDRLIAQKADHEITKSSLANIYEKIHKLDDHHTRQIDENRKISKRIDVLTESVSCLDETLDEQLDILKVHNYKQDERIEKLESMLTPKFKVDDTLYKELESRKPECDHQWVMSELFTGYKQCSKCRKMEDQVKHYHPRDKIKLCPHGNILPNCTACY